MDHDLLCLLYAGFLATGGVIGYLKKGKSLFFSFCSSIISIGSLPSLLAAVGTGALVAFSTYFALPFQPTIVAGMLSFHLILSLFIPTHYLIMNKWMDYSNLWWFDRGDGKSIS